jgi:hypothetical protein
MSTSDDILRNCEEIRMEMTLVVSRGGGHPGSFKYLISHWNICAVVRGGGRIVISHTFL